MYIYNHVIFYLNEMNTFLINGGNPISGEIVPAGSKNAILPLIAAALLSSEEVLLTGVPAISDVRVMLKLIKKLGGKYNITNRGETLLLNSESISKFELDKELSIKIRGSNLLVAPLLVKLGKVKAWVPGGDKIGLRDMSAHYDGFVQSGYKVTENIEEGSFTVEKDPEFNSKDVNIFLYEPSVTATENIIMLNVIGDGNVTIYNAACEPHVRDLCVLLEEMGAIIQGIGTNKLSITKVKKLHTAEHVVVKDHIYITSFLIFSLVTNGELFIKDVIYEDMLPVLTGLKKFNVRYEFIDNNVLHIFNNQDLKITHDLYNNSGIYSQPWPMVPSDALPLFTVLATQSEGEFIIFEKMYCDRLKYTVELNKMGADIKILDDFRVGVKGKTLLHQATLTCPDIRSGILYLAGALAAKGTSCLKNIEHIERAYPHIERVLKNLGADITIKHEDNI